MTHDSQDFRFPADRRLRLWVRRRELLTFTVLALGPPLFAGAYYLLFGLPTTLGVADPASPSGPHGFPLWVRASHYLNFLFLVLLTRSGLQILMDHPRLYWNVHCTPGTEWIRFTPLRVPTDRPYNSLEDARYLTPWIGLPGGRHTIGLARHWHFLTAILWTLTGIFFVSMLIITRQWERVIPQSWRALPEAFNVFVHYATFHMPKEPDGFYRYNSLQLISYGAIVFVAGPLTILTGLAMSPAIDGHLPWYPRLFGNRQIARSIHFLLVVGYLSFTAVHVFFVVITGVLQNLNHVVLGSDETGIHGLLIAAGGIGLVVLLCWVAHRISQVRPRQLQQVALALVEGIMRGTTDKLTPLAEYKKEEISPHFWTNGKMPTSDEWKRLKENHWADYRLRVGGLVANPVELSLDDLRRMSKKEQITQHHCIQGWSGIAEWGGLPLSALIDHVKPGADARHVIFRSFGEGLEPGEYYEAHSMRNALHPQSLLAYEMNYEPLGEEHGAPLRLRVENQLGYKMVKWIKSIEFVGDLAAVGKGHGGKNEDDEYFDIVANW